MNLEYFRGKNIALVGFGVENISVARFLFKHGIDFVVLDQSPIEKLSDEAQKEVRSKKLGVRS